MVVDTAGIPDGDLVGLLALSAVCGSPSCGSESGGDANVASPCGRFEDVPAVQPDFVDFERKARQRTLGSVAVLRPPLLRAVIGKPRSCRSEGKPTRLPHEMQTVSGEENGILQRGIASGDYSTTTVCTYSRMETLHAPPLIRARARFLAR